MNSWFINHARQSKNILDDTIWVCSFRLSQIMMSCRPAWLSPVVQYPCAWKLCSFDVMYSFHLEPKKMIFFKALTWLEIKAFFFFCNFVSLEVKDENGCIFKFVFGLQGQGHKELLFFDLCLIAICCLFF